MPADAIEILKNFDSLSDDVLIPPKVTALVINTCERTIRRNNLLPRVQLSARRVAHRVGDVRALARSGKFQGKGPSA